MSLSIVLTDSMKTIESNINRAIAEEMNDRLSKNLSNITRDISNLIPSWIKSQPEILSLSSNDAASLKGQFGIFKDTQEIINKIISSVQQATSVKFIQYSPKLKGGFELQFQPSTFSNLLALPEGHTIYSGGDLHWLDWLLMRGDSIIVTNYEYNPKTGLGRSGLGNMTSGGSFRVPPQFSGTADNNFITRAFLGSNQEKQITDIFIKYLS